MSFVKILRFPILWLLHRSWDHLFSIWPLHISLAQNSRKLKILLLGNASRHFDGHPNLRGILTLARINDIQSVCQLAGMRAGSYGLNQGRRLYFGIHSLAGCSCLYLLVLVVCFCWSFVGHCFGRNMEHHVAGRPQGGGDVFLKCDRCCKPVRSPNGSCS